MNTGVYLIAGGAVALAVGNGPVHAADPPVVFEYNTPSNTNPWLKATISNRSPISGVDAVEIKLNSLLQSANEFFPGSPSSPPPNNVAVAFNFTEPIPQNIVSFCADNIGTGCRQGTPVISVAENGIDFPAGTPFTGFDLALFLAIEPNTFGGSNEVTFTLISQGISASKFNTANASGYCTAAQVDGIASRDLGSSTMIANFCGEKPNPTKTPAPLPILGASMAFGFSRRLRRRVRGSEASIQASIG